jgi:hypothetical protein
MKTLKRILRKRGETRAIEGTWEYRSRPAKNNKLQIKERSSRVTKRRPNTLIGTYMVRPGSRSRIVTSCFTSSNTIGMMMST